MHIATLPALEDNYIYVISNGEEAAVVDPGEAAPVERFLQEHNLRLTTILLTHAHADHTAGAGPLKRATGCTVVGPAESGLRALDRDVRGGDRVTVPGGTLEVLDTPGHRPVHVSYFEASARVLFCGDTLFGAGCGRIMGASASDLWASLLRLRDLPPETQIYCGHEYTVNNLEFAAAQEPENVAVRERLGVARAQRASGQPTIPSTLALERTTNPFLRADDSTLRRSLNMETNPPVAVFAELRRRKDRWY